MSQTSELLVQQAYQTLAQTAERFAINDGRNGSIIPGLVFYRHSRSSQSMPCIYPLGLVLTLQGSKEIRLAEQRYRYGVGDILFVGAGLSAYSYVAECNTEQPYLGVALELDWTQLAHAAAQWPSEKAARSESQILLINAEHGLLQALVRLSTLADEPQLLPHLVPLLQSEIMHRLLAGNRGRLLRQMLAVNTPLPQISRAAAWLKEHYAEKTAVAALAQKVHMSESSFRQHFKRITGVSPLQYQKQLRLQQARQLMHSEKLSAAEAAARVGYESPSQFSREYRRFFGLPPTADTER